MKRNIYSPTKMGQKLAGTEKNAMICNIAFEKKHQVRVPTSQQKHHFFKAAFFSQDSQAKQTKQGASSSYNDGD